MDRRRFLAIAGVGLLAKSVSAIGMPRIEATCPGGLPDIRSVPPDLIVPDAEDGPPRAGRRVRRTLSEYQGTEVHHTLYLPTDWQPGRRYPVLIEYPGNGPYTSPCGDVSSGEVEGCKLGYGISGGRGFVWAALPCVDPSHRRNQLWWWGDVDATLAYCRAAVKQICEQFGGDSAAVILCGFSRGAIACNFIGLHDDAIAGLWLGFMASSHYDGVRQWDYAGSDRASAEKRLARLRGRATFIAQEVSTQDIQDYLRSTGARDPFTFQTLHFGNHTDAWVLRDIPERRALRAWVADLLRRRPGRPRGRSR